MFAVAEKAPPHANNLPFVAFEDYSAQIFPVKKKLQDEIGGGDVIRPAAWKFCKIDRIGNRGAQEGIVF